MNSAEEDSRAQLSSRELKLPYTKQGIAQMPCCLVCAGG
jgi:hypothetical protein